MSKEKETDKLVSHTYRCMHGSEVVGDSVTSPRAIQFAFSRIKVVARVIGTILRECRAVEFLARSIDASIASWRLNGA